VGASQWQRYIKNSFTEGTNAAVGNRIPPLPEHSNGGTTMVGGSSGYESCKRSACSSASRELYNLKSEQASVSLVSNDEFRTIHPMDDACERWNGGKNARKTRRTPNHALKGNRTPHSSANMQHALLLNEADHHGQGRLLIMS